MEIRSNPEFEEWATGYSGCDGGNLKGPIWFCGIEFGGGHTKESLVFSNVSNPPSIPFEKLNKQLRFQYNQKVAKLYTAVSQEPLTTWRDVAKATQLFGSNSGIFKMNLYPIAFHRDSDELWESWLFERTGLPTKSIYRAWCQLYRFPQIKKWMEYGNPRLIIGTGLSYTDHFNFAFSGNDAAYQPFENEEKIETCRLLWRLINSGTTVLAVVPFLGGASGLKSDVQLTAIGQRLEEICVGYFGPEWRVCDS
jgi:hypothetical protein